MRNIKIKNFCFLGYKNIKVFLFILYVNVLGVLENYKYFFIVVWMTIKGKEFYELYKAC